MLPRPVDPHAPRYCPGESFPGTPYLPGITERPPDDLLRHLEGELARVPWERFAETALFRLGVDFYNHAYFWEAHEAWEILWQRCPESPLRLALQGLIQLTAGLLKEHLQVPSGARKLGASAVAKLEAARGAPVPIDLDALIPRIERHFEHFDTPAPGLRLS